jgi:uncharacterized protein YjbI with pentapeptide repeats
VTDGYNLIHEECMPDVGTNGAETEPSQTCQIEMHGGKPCGRPADFETEDDWKPVCLMHTKDPDKTDADFQEEFERTLTEAEQAGIEADFSKFVFPNANYAGRTFVPPCHFGGAVFTVDVSFRKATFAQNADFEQVHFKLEPEWPQKANSIQTADFIGATFCQDANFRGAQFEKADFTQANFTHADFSGLAVFFGHASFGDATFTKDADFSDANFCHGVSFRNARFSDAFKFWRAILTHNLRDAWELDYSGVKIEQPGNVEFYKVDLRRALFYHTDVSKIVFTLVEWPDRRQPGRKRLFEEVVDLKSVSELRSSECSSDQYRQLKRNCDAKGDYWTAGHWHYGEMEMKRQHSHWRWRPLRWLSHHFSLVALYKYASAYGESYVLPLLWLAGVLAFFAAFYSIAGLELDKDSGGGVVGYWNLAEFCRTHPAEHPSGLWGLLLHGFMTAVSVAGFQRELKFAPSYPWGRLMALMELLLTTTLGGLFALAIRRQFKR